MAKKRIELIWEFLKAARNLVKNKDMSKEGILRFAKQQFGEIDDFLKLQIDNLFRKPKVISPVEEAYKTQRRRLEGYLGSLDRNSPDFQEAADITIKKLEKLERDYKAGKFVPEGQADVVPIKAEEGIMATDEATKIVKKRTDDIASGDPTGELTAETSDLMTRFKETQKTLKEALDDLKKTSQDTTPGGIMKEIMKGQKVMAENYKTGNIRTAVRQFMRSEADAGRLKLSADDLDSLKVYGQTTESDPINIFRRYYGEDALESVDEIGDVFRHGESFKHYEELLRKSVSKAFLTPKTKGFGKYDEGVLTPEQENELRRQLLKEQDQKKMLEDWDPDREPSADGGIIGNLHLNRTGYFAGRLVKAREVGKKILDLLKDKKKLKAAWDDIFPSDDYKYDAEMVSESLVENNPKEFGGRLYEDLTDPERTAVYGAALTEASTNFAKTLQMKRAMRQTSKPTKTLKSIEETGTINISDDEVASEFARFMEETDPKGHAKVQKVVDDINQKIELEGFKPPKDKKGHADGGLINILKL